LKDNKNYNRKGTPKFELAEIVFGSCLIPAQKNIPGMIEKILKRLYGKISDNSAEENKTGDVKGKVFWKWLIQNITLFLL
jgi:hypothetical protein